MAPEYVVRGKLSEKADVYSFGVFAIEVITGRRNGHFYQDSTSILQKVMHIYPLLRSIYIYISFHFVKLKLRLSSLLFH